MPPVCPNIGSLLHVDWVTNIHSISNSTYLHMHLQLEVYRIQYKYVYNIIIFMSIVLHAYFNVFAR